MRFTDKGLAIATVVTVLLFLTACGEDCRESTFRPWSADTLATLSRGFCFGACPVYSVTVFDDGFVLYHGVQHVHTLGYAESSLDAREVHDLIDAFLAIDYFSLQDSYYTRADGCTLTATDLPSAQTSFRYDGRKKVVDHYHGCIGPAELPDLEALEDRIDEMLDTRRWVDARE